MDDTVSLTINVDSEVIREAEALFSALGTTLEEAVNAFLRDCLHSSVRPPSSSPNIPNAVTLAAFKETEELLERVKAGDLVPFKSADEMLAELKK